MKNITNNEYSNWSLDKGDYSRDENSISDKIFTEKVKETVNSNFVYLLFLVFSIVLTYIITSNIN